MNRKRIWASKLSAVGYQEETQVLEIEFFDGAIYQYTKVPKHIYQALMITSAQDIYFEQCIKGKYSENYLDSV